MKLAEVVRNVALARKIIDGPGCKEKSSYRCTIHRLHLKLICDMFT